MVKKRILEALESSDVKTKRWRSTFAAGRMAYEAGEFRQAETLLARAREMACELPERSFAENAADIGGAAILLATGRSPQAKSRLQKTVSALESYGDNKHKELLGVALRFYAQSLVDVGDVRAAEKELQKSADILQKCGSDAAVQLAYTLCDLCGLYIAEHRYSQAEQNITKAMRIISAVLGPEAPEYVRADMIYTTCLPMAADTRLDVAAEGIGKMQYFYGAKHPNINRALNRYIQVLQENGQKEKIEEIRKQFNR